jgi:hypothetical protein
MIYFSFLKVALQKVVVSKSDINFSTRLTKYLASLNENSKV